MESTNKEWTRPKGPSGAPTSEDTPDEGSFKVEMSFRNGDIGEEISEDNDDPDGNEKSTNNKGMKQYKSLEVGAFSIGDGEYYLLKEYFDSLYNEVLKEDDMEIESIKVVQSTGSVYYSDTCLTDPLNNGVVIDVIYNGEKLMMNINSHIDSMGVKHIHLHLMVKHETYYTCSTIFDDIKKRAITNSGLKGSYIQFKGNAKHGWEEADLDKRTFNDIFVPEETMKDIKLYKEYFEKKGYLMTYLFSGPPGTGKTEANRALAYLLNKDGVTIIKTGITEDLKEKIEIAELLSPSLIVIDDIDLYLGNRKNGISKPLLQTFLDALDGFDKMGDGVGMITTTNSTHLLDLAAQRPGRFDRVLIMDTLTKDNIKHIILKALRYEFGKKEKSKAAKVLTQDDVINRIDDYKFTGARVYNAVKMYMRRIMTDETDEDQPDLKGFLSLIDNEKGIMNKIEGEGGFGGEDQLTNYMNNENENKKGIGYR